MTIEKFYHEYSFLSNFYPCRVEFENDIYASSEHAYQAAKSDDPIYRGMIKRAVLAGSAKQLGKDVTVRENWNDIKVDIMRQILKKKFENPQLRKLLLDTYPHELIQGNTWKDTFWGVYKGKGKNILGILLMQVRSEFRGEGW